MNAASFWLLLMHSVPPQPPYLRAKVMRRLTRVGALALKRSAYLLPSGDTALEDFQWLRREIQEEGGDAWIVEARFVGGLRDEQIRDNFRAMRNADYRALIAEARALLERMERAGSPQHDSAIDADRRRLARRLEATRRIDFFQADGREEAEAVMGALDRVTGTDSGERGPAEAPRRGELRGRTWMTRAGVKVDRMASAWLIRRFIDPSAEFVFVSADRQVPAAGAIRFDMFEGEFTHDANRCTFEVLLDVVGRPGDRALAELGHIVHDLDLHDDRYQRTETAGVGAMLAGIVSRFDGDEQRLVASGPLFDALYASLGGRTPPAPQEQP